MRSLTRNGTILTLLGAVLVLTACKPAGNATQAADEAAVRKVLDNIVSTFNAGDYDAMLSNYADDLLVQSSAGPDITSKAAWREALKTSLPPDVKVQMRFDIAELTLSGDLAYERGVFTLQPAGSGADAVLFKGRYTHILKRDAGGAWKGWRLFEIIDQMPPAAAPAAPAK